MRQNNQFIMKILQNFDWSFKSIAKIFGLVIWWILVVTVVISLLSLSFNTMFNWWMMRDWYWWWYPMREPMMEKSMSLLNQDDVRQSPWWATEEDYEIKDYSADIKTSNKDEICADFSSLKSKDYVIFENSNNWDNSCYFRFKVLKENEKEIIAKIEGYKPEYFNVNIQTIKRQVENFETEIDILNKKLRSVEDTITEAQKSYDELMVLATEKQDTESLAKIVDSKLNLFNNLTNQRQDIRSKIQRYSRDKSLQLEKLKYSFFNVNVIANLIVDWKEIKNSWKYQVQEFVSDLNNIAQDLTVNLVNYIVRFFQVVVYFFISLFILKLVWFFTKKIWKGNEQVKSWPKPITIKPNQIKKKRIIKKAK